MSKKPDWQQQGQSRMTDEQRRMLNARCGDLAAQLKWHGRRLTKDSFRHLISGTVMGWIMVPGICRGEGDPGFIMLGGSSLRLTKTAASDAIACALAIGDDPKSQGIDSPPVKWSDAVLHGLGFSDSDIQRMRSEK